jgi:hypothetical protein
MNDPLPCNSIQRHRSIQGRPEGNAMQSTPRAWTGPSDAGPYRRTHRALVWIELGPRIRRARVEMGRIES